MLAHPFPEGFSRVRGRWVTLLGLLASEWLDPINERQGSSIRALSGRGLWVDSGNSDTVKVR